MFLTYIDESGKPNFNDCEKEYVLASITIHESDYKRAESELHRIKYHYFPHMDPDNVEIHASDIVSRKGLFKELGLQERLTLLSEVLDILSEFNPVVNIVIIRKNALNSKETDIDAIAFKLLFERLCMTHRELNKKLLLKEEDIQFGILFMDSIQPKYDEIIKTKVRKMIKAGTEYIDNEFIIEDVVFIDSRYRAMSQIVDCIAYCVRRYYRSQFNGIEGQDLDYYSDCYSKILFYMRRKNADTVEGAG